MIKLTQREIDMSNENNDENFAGGLAGLIIIGVIVYLAYSYFTQVNYTFNYNGQTLTSTGGSSAEGQKYGGKWEDLAYFGPKQQVFMKTLIDQTQRSVASSDSSAMKKKLWIDASNQLCTDKTFDAFGTKRNWIGRVSSISMQDDGDITVYLKIDNDDNKVVDTISTSMDNFQAWENLLLSLREGNYVQFSGVFLRGDRSENECLNASSLFSDSTPELSDKNFKFNLYSLGKIELKEIKS